MKLFLKIIFGIVTVSACLLIFRLYVVLSLESNCKKFPCYVYCGTDLDNANDPYFYVGEDSIGDPELHEATGQEALSMAQEINSFDAFIMNHYQIGWGSTCQLKQTREAYNRTSGGTELDAFELTRKVETDQQVTYEKGYVINDEKGTTPIKRFEELNDLKLYRKHCGDYVDDRRECLFTFFIALFCVPLLILFWKKLNNYETFKIDWLLFRPKWLDTNSNLRMRRILSVFFNFLTFSLLLILFAYTVYFIFSFPGIIDFNRDGGVSPFVIFICGVIIYWLAWGIISIIHWIFAPSDYTETLKLAEQGVAAAENKIGDMYYSGEGIIQDYGEAMKWYRKAANQGNAEGEYNIGILYWNGYSVPEDYDEAMKWFKKAAKQGNLDAEYCIGVMYESGQGVPQDNNEAIRWYKKAAEEGQIDAIKALKALERLATDLNENL